MNTTLPLPEPVVAAVPDTKVSGSQPPLRYRALLTYRVVEDLRYLSHHDELRMLNRALVRAAWPVAYSQGFNPLPRVSIVLPRKVGTAADVQVAVVDLAQAASASDLFGRLRAALPALCDLRSVALTTVRQMPHAQRMIYRVPLAPTDAALAAQGRDGFLATVRHVVSRSHRPGKPTQTLDIRPFVADVRLVDDGLEMDLRIVNQRSARPTEVLTALGIDAAAYEHRLRRAALHWNMDSTAPEDGRPACERTNLGHKDHLKEEDHIVEEDDGKEDHA